MAGLSFSRSLHNTSYSLDNFVVRIPRDVLRNHCLLLLPKINFPVLANLLLVLNAHTQINYN